MNHRSCKLIGNYPTILIPIEKITRELDSKIVLATILGTHGCRTIVAQTQEAFYISNHSKYLLFLGKEVIQGGLDYRLGTQPADRILQNGSAIIYLHDEGGMYQRHSWEEQVIGKHRIDALAPRNIDRICTWGDKQRDLISKYAPTLGSRLRVTGSPRFDICAPHYEWLNLDGIQKIYSQFGDFILVCTRFGSIANKKGLQHMFQQKISPQSWPKALTLDELTNLWFVKWRQDVHDFAEFVILVKELASAFPDRKIILRPHPNESIIFYQQAFFSFKNVEVIHEGNILNWIRAAALIVHSNCTTGIEAVLAGRPVLNYLPGSEERADLDVEVAREAGETARSLNEAMVIAEALLAGKPHNHPWSPHAISILNNLKTDAIPILVDEILAIIRARGLDNPFIKLPPSWPESMGRFGNLLRRVSGLYQQKTGLLDLNHIEKILNASRANEVGAARIRKFTPHYVVIDPI